MTRHLPADVVTDWERQREAERGHALKRAAAEIRKALDGRCQCGQMTVGECTWNPVCVLNGGAGQ